MTLTLKILITITGLSWRKSHLGKKTENRYEYEIKIRPDGSQYTYRIETVVNGIKTETVYSECCGLPLRITRGKHTTTFEYNKDGLLTKKTSTKGDYVELEYEKKHKKISGNPRKSKPHFIILTFF